MKVLFSAFLLLNVYAAAHPIDPLIGRYPILQYNGDVDISGVVEIKKTETTAGFVVSPLKMASKPAAFEEWLTPLGSTDFKTAGNEVYQHYEKGRSTTDIIYRKQDGYIDVDSTSCSDSGCKILGLKLSAGKSDGNPINVTEFFEKRVGTYVIASAGGKKPKDELTEAVVQMESKDVNFVLPYCSADGSFCDPGYLNFPVAATAVFQRAAADGGKVFDIFVNQSPQSLYYKWIEESTRLLFKNYQYALGEERVSLEHELIAKVP